jgi:hypothetical protein
MSMTTSFPNPLCGPGGGLLRETVRQMLRTGLLAIVLAFTLITLYQAYLVSQEPGRVIRRELTAAAGEFGGQLVPDPSDAVRLAIRRHFSEPAVDVAASRFSSNVAVTIRGLDQEACENATLQARRIEGPVVVSLAAYASPADCRARNDMTWWIMP